MMRGDANAQRKKELFFSCTMLRHAVKNNNSPNGNDPNATNHGYNASDFLEDSSSSSSSSIENEEDYNAHVDDDLTLRAPLPNFHMLFQIQASAAETTAIDYTTSHHRQLEQQVRLKNHDDCLRPFISALLVSCRVLRLSMETTFTAACLLHRFAIAHSSTKSLLLKNQKPTLHHHDDKNDDGDDDDAKNHNNDKQHENNNNTDDWRWIIAACIFLACKVEEEPRRLRDLINMAHMITFHNDNDNALVEENVTPSVYKKQQVNQASLSNEQRQDDATTAGDDDASSVAAALLYWESEPPNLDSRYWQAKETLVKAEQNVLRWLAFDVTVSHPHRAVIVLLLSQQKQQTQQNDTIQNNGNNNKPEVVINIQQQLPLSSLPADAATGTLMIMPVNGISYDTQDQQYQKNHDLLAHNAWTFLNNTVFFVEALRHDVISLATAALEMAQEQSQFITVQESVQHESAPTTGTTTAAAAGDDTAKQENKEKDAITARPFKKLRSGRTKDENDTNVAAVASARHSLQDALARVQRLSEMSNTFTT